MTLLNAHTKVPAHQTLGEVMGLLAKAGARQVQVTYDENGLPDGLSFSLQTAHGLRSFVLPVNAAQVQSRLADDYMAGRIALRQSTPEHARNVGWRILKDWIQAQLAILESGMVSADEILLPWMQIGDGRTVYQGYVDNVLKLPAGATNA